MVQDGGEVVAAEGAPSAKKLNFFQQIALFIRQVLIELRNPWKHRCTGDDPHRRFLWTIEARVMSAYL